MIILAALALAVQDQDVYPAYPDGPPAVVQPQAAPPADKHARKDLARRLERAGDLYETLGQCTGSLTIEEVQALLASARDGGPAGAYLTGRFEAGLRKPHDDDDWCRKAVGKRSTTF